MKKFLLILPLFILMLTSCTEKNQLCDIYDFAESFNEISGSEIIQTSDFVCTEENILYCFIDKACLSFYINEKTGNIEKCNIVFDKVSVDKSILEKVKKSLEKNSKYYERSEYSSDGKTMITFEDSRYIKENNSPTLKKQINQEDLY